MRKASDIICKLATTASGAALANTLLSPGTLESTGQKTLDLGIRTPIPEKPPRLFRLKRRPITSNVVTTMVKPPLEENLGFVARAFAHMGLPHRNPGDLRSFERMNGIYRLKITADDLSKLPYGSIPRVLLAFVGTEAVRTQSREIYLGQNLSEFLPDKLHMQVTGGARGTIGAVREQAWRLFTCTVSITAEINQVDEHRKRLSKMLIAEDIELWWTSKAKNQASLWESRLELSQKFFNYVIDKPVPIDWEAVRQLRRSPLALDLYFWLTHRMSYLRQQTTVSWIGPGSLAEQLGSNYGDDRFGARVRIPTM